MKCLWTLTTDSYLKHQNIICISRILQVVKCTHTENHQNDYSLYNFLSVYHLVKMNFLTKTCFNQIDMDIEIKLDSHKTEYLSRWRKVNISLCNWYLNPFPHYDTFWRPWETSLLKTLWEKEKLLITSNFSISQCFLPIWIAFCYFHQIWNCRLQILSVWKSLKFVVW